MSKDSGTNKNRSKKSMIKNLSDKYRLVFLDNESFEEKGAIVLSKLSIAVYFLFDIDWKGARKIRRNYNKNDIIDFFILPPSKSELKRRLIKRGRENKKEISLRLSYAIDEMNHYNEYKYVLINEKVHNTVNEIKKIVEYHQLITKQKKFLRSKLKKIINS